MLGRYKPPRYRYGQTVRCEVRGELVIVGTHEAPIPWPVGKRGQVRAIVVYGDLARAVRRESVAAVAHHWRVNRQTAWKWRKALGVPEFTEGTRRLHAEQAVALPGMVEGRARAPQANRDPEKNRERLVKVRQMAQASNRNLRLPPLVRASPRSLFR